MIKKIYCIKDIKTSYQPELVVFDSDSAAKRWFHQLIFDYQSSDRLKNAPLVLYPEDFILQCLGEFNILSGVVQNYLSSPEEDIPCPVLVCRASDFLGKE